MPGSLWKLWVNEFEEYSGTAVKEVCFCVKAAAAVIEKSTDIGSVAVRLEVTGSVVNKVEASAIGMVTMQRKDGEDAPGLEVGLVVHMSHIRAQGVMVKTGGHMRSKRGVEVDNFRIVGTVAAKREGTFGREVETVHSLSLAEERIVAPLVYYQQSAVDLPDYQSAGVSHLQSKAGIHALVMEEILPLVVAVVGILPFVVLGSSGYTEEDTPRGEAGDVSYF